MKTFGLSPALVRSASFIAIATGLALPGAAFAQTDAAAPPAAQDTSGAQQGTPAADTASQANGGDIIVTGIRASLERSIEIKRNSFGVVDAISAEDIGKFPSTNLAESLQRITGVSIDRVNGEGAQVTVRGFGPDYNLVTLDGRTLASTYDQTVGGDESGDGIHAIGRSFDFSNLATGGVKTLEVYKTGRAAVPSGGIGATINVVTRRPLDGPAGLTGTIEAKGDYNESWRDCADCGGPLTPDLTGVASWSNQSHTFGVSLFGSYSEQHFSTISATSNDWNIVPYSTFLTGGYVNAATKINNPPSNPNQLVSVPNDSRYHFSDDEYKRFNAQAVIEWKPFDALTLTANALYANNIEREQRSDESNWFNRPFDVVTFDGNSAVDTTTYLHETLSAPKDEDWEQQDRAQRNRLQDYGLNAKWDITNNFSFTLDGHYGKSQVDPYLSNGTTSTLVGLGGDVVAAHSVDYSSGIPVEHIVFDDSHIVSEAPGGTPGVLDTTDVSSTVGRTFTNSVSQRVKEIRGDFGWDLGDGSRIDFGGIYRDTKTRQQFASTQQTLGDWSASKPGDVDKYAPGVLNEFCLTCRFHDFNPQATGVDAIAFRGDAVTLLNALSPAYGGSLNPNGGVNSDDEKIWGGYAQATWKFHLGGMDAGLVAGVRFEHTEENAVSLQDVPTAIVWTSDNDFIVQYSSTPQAVTGKGSYNNFLPSADFQLHLTNNLIARLSGSRTMARPDYNLLFPSTSVGGPPRPTAIGGFASGSENNTGLKPLVSDNLDASLEWYFKRDSYVSVGGFYKHVKNFIGTGVTSGPLFGLRDPTSGAAGTRSGEAKTALTGLGAGITDVNLFTMTALIDKYNGNVANATTEFSQHYTAGALDQDYVNQILTAYDVTADASDPLFNFAISEPINNRAADLYGVEVAGQYFFGNTGIGVSGSFTYVDGNVNFDNGGDPNVDQFALTGLSNTANATLIYDKYGISARLAYNWRDKFLSAVNRDGYHNPVYTAPFATVDFDFTYDITPHWSISITGQNLTNESLHTYGREKTNLWFYQELQRRFSFGASYKF